MTSTTTSFSTMLNEYLPNELFREELIKRDYVLNKVDKDDSWLGGNLIVPFEGGVASSFSFGSLTGSTDIAEYNYQRGSITSQPEAWGSLIFNHKDLMQHGKLSEQNFLQMLPNQVEQFMQYIKEVVSVNITGATYFASATVAGTTLGVLEVDHVERFTIGQKVVLMSGITSVTTNQANYYVIAVDLNGGTALNGSVVLSATRGGSAANISAFTYSATADLNTHAFHDGICVANVITNGFTSMRASLLSLANGGSTSLYGKTKTTYPYLQAVNVDGSSITSSNFLEKLFDAYNAVRIKARGNASTFLMSYKNLGSAMKAIETQKGGFKTSVNSTTANQYGWTEIKITSVKGELTLVGIQEMDDDIVPMIDWTALKFYSNGFFQKRKDPENGNEFFPVRNTTGFQYIVDIALMGDLVVLAPSRCGIIFGISY